MPAFLTHWRVLIETAKRSQDAGNDLGSLIIDASALRRRAQGRSMPPQTNPTGAIWDTGPLPRVNFTFPGSDISAMAFLGALAPDIPSFQRDHFSRKISGDRQRELTALAQTPAFTAGPPLFWSNLLHLNRSGDVLIALLEHIADIPSPALRSQALAFAMGYLSHIATDIALNPCVNTLAGAYAPSKTQGIFTRFGIHFYIELCLDEYIAQTYFDRPLYGWFKQPWGQYIEPAATNCLTPGSLSTQVLHLLTNAVEATYGLTEAQSNDFQASYLAGLRRLRNYLSGTGTFRLLTLSTLVRNHTDDPIPSVIAEHAHKPGTLNFEQVIAYAVHLSEHLCRNAISYYAALRHREATANERNTRRAALCEDVRNWNLETGYTVDVTFDEQVTLHLLHNWVHFARLWENERETALNVGHR
jgi:Zinc dependent phospholipase C